MTDFYSKYLDLINNQKNNYRGAGFIFYQNNNNDIDFLLGVDNKFKDNKLNVFGGGKEKTDKSSLHTACREVFEELFNVYPTGLDIFVERIQKGIDSHDITEKIFLKKENEVCYFADIKYLNLFIEHLIYHEGEWTFKNNHQYKEYKDDIIKFIGDRVLKSSQKAKNGLNEIKRIYLVKWSHIKNAINKTDENHSEPVKINNKKYLLRDNLQKYLKEDIIIDIINKNLN